MRIVLFSACIFYLGSFCTPNSGETTQPFVKSYGGPGSDQGVSVIQTNDGGYAAVGVTDSFGAGGEDVYLVRINQKGDSLWTRSYGGQLNDNGWAIRQNDTGFLIAGFSNSFGKNNMDYYLVQTDHVGNEKWSQTYGTVGDEYCWDMVADRNGGYVLAGETGKAGEYRTGQKDFYLVRVDQTGKMLWQMTYDHGGTERAFAVRQTHDDGFILVGSTTSLSGGNPNVLLVKTDPKGNQEWSKTFGSDAFDMGHDVAVTEDGGFAVIGYTESFGARKRDAWLLKVDGQGNETWSRLFGGEEDDHVVRGIATSDGFFLSGYSKSFSSHYGDLYLIRTDMKGEMLWNRTYSGGMMDTGYGLCPTSDGGVLVTGQTYMMETKRDLLLILFDKAGSPPQ